LTTTDRQGSQMEPRTGQEQGDNANYPWDDFDSADYFQHNYSALRHDDQQILEAMRDFFPKADPNVHAAGKAADERPLRGLDVGSGTNLYPSLAMLPFCSELTLWEYSARNTAWLRSQIRSYAESWDTFWKVLAQASPYDGTADPRALLAERARVLRGSVFDLPAAGWDMGTMFFVAESLTTSPAEFEAATHRFIAALRPGAPFAAAFMENSTGYTVGAQDFPAVAVTKETVRGCLAKVSPDLDVQRIDSGNEPLRDGYSGMILVLGTVGAG
jgi:hypothetical protein